MLQSQILLNVIRGLLAGRSLLQPSGELTDTTDVQRQV